MKTLVLILLFFIGNSCDPTNTNTVDEASEAVEVNDANNNPPIQESMNPGQITLQVRVMEVYDSNKEICGSSRTNVMKMDVLNVLERGSSIVNVPSDDDQIFMNFVLTPKDLSVNSQIKVTARESLCRDTSKTYFTIISYEIVE